MIKKLKCKCGLTFVYNYLRGAEFETTCPRCGTKYYLSGIPYCWFEEGIDIKDYLPIIRKAKRRW